MANRSGKPLIAIVLVILAVAVAGITGSQTQSSRDILTRPVPPADYRIAYGNEPLQFGELRLPKGAGPHPVAVIVHGGCWMAEYGLSYMGHISAALTESGIATWNVEYRRVGNPGGGWPGTFQDIAQATDYLRTVAKTYPIDLNRIIAIGHSAGGQLVLWAAARNRLSKDNPFYEVDVLKLNGVVPLAGITDLQKTGTACDRLVLKLMGGEAKEFDSRYRQVSPIALLPLGVEQTVIQGETDNIVPASMARDYYEAAKRKGDNVKLVVIEKTGHFELVDPKSSAWTKVKEEVLEMVRSKI